jgi:protein MpaA
VGRSAEGRAIKAVVLGPDDAAARLLVVGSVHGNETAGHAIVRALLRRGTAPAGAQLWIVRTFNPDGVVRGTRQNARGVDLNRNAPFAWEPLPRGVFYSGTGPASEPETRAAVKLVRRIRPAATLWYHQAMAIVGGRGWLERGYARTVGLPAGDIPGHYPGSLATWQDRRVEHTNGVVVELPGGALGAAQVRRHVRAVVQAARGLVRRANA